MIESDPKRAVLPSASVSGRSRLSRMWPADTLRRGSEPGSHTVIGAVKSADGVACVRIKESTAYEAPVARNTASTSQNSLGLLSCFVCVTRRQRRRLSSLGWKKSKPETYPYTGCTLALANITSLRARKKLSMMPAHTVMFST